MKGTANMRVAVAGYFGWGNFGDQLFLDTVLHNKERLWPDAADVICMTRRDLDTHALRPWWGRVLRFIYTLRVALRTTTLAYCGGSVFWQLGGADRLRSLLAPKNLEALGVSVGPFASQHDAAAVSTYLARFNRVVFRDDSWQAVSHQFSPEKPEEGGDLAALTHRIPTSPNRSGIVACPSHAAGSDMRIFARQVEQALGKLRLNSPDASVTLLSLNSHPKLGDKALCDEVQKLLDESGIYSEVKEFTQLGLQSTCDALSSAELVISQRLHGAIVAYLSGGRFLMVDHHPKCRAFVEAIGGHPELCADPTQMDIAASITVALDTTSLSRVTPEEYIIRARDVYFRQEQ